MDPLQAQAFKTQDTNRPEDIWQPLYDRVNYPAAGQLETTFFANPKGTSATLVRGVATATVNKTDRDTNLTNASVVPAKMFKVIGLSIGYIHAGLTNATNQNDRSNWRNNSYIKYRIVDKDILIVPTLAIPELNPICGVATTTNATNMIAEVGGGGPGLGMYLFPVPLIMMPYENFTVVAVNDGAQTVTVTMDVCLMLQAYMRRPT